MVDRPKNLEKMTRAQLIVVIDELLGSSSATVEKGKGEASGRLTRN